MTLRKELLTWGVAITIAAPRQQSCGNPMCLNIAALFLVLNTLH